MGGFKPDIAAARDAVAVIAEKRAESVRAIATGLAPHCPDSAALAERLKGLETRPVPAVASALYFDLLQAVIDDDVDEASASLDAFLAALDRPLPPPLRGWDDLPTADQHRVLRHINSDPTTRVDLISPDVGALAAATTAIAGAFALFDQAAPELADEIRCLIREIILVTGRVNEAESFDGATAFGLWGALFLNAAEHGDRIDAVDGLSHEAAHSLLFGLSLGRPLVDNPPEERFASPLRFDPRPLDGIFHATFVSARMNYAHARVLALPGALDEYEADVSRRRLADSRQSFFDGLATLRAHAQLTPLGARLLGDAERFMTQS